METILTNVEAGDPGAEEPAPKELDSVEERLTRGLLWSSYFAAIVYLLFYLTLVVNRHLSQGLFPDFLARLDPDTSLPFPTPGLGLAILMLSLFMIGYDIVKRSTAEESFKKFHDRLVGKVKEGARMLSQEVEERRWAEQQLHLAAEVIEHLNQGVVTLDADFRVVSVNPAYTAITGFTAKESIGKPPPFDATLKQEAALYAELQQGMEDSGHWEGELWDVRKDGKNFAEYLSITAITDVKGKTRHYAAIVNDITKRKEDEDRIRYQANFDALTGLPNRSLFLDRLGQALANAVRTGHQLGLMFIDLDGFKLVNDTLGHDHGDLLLQETARRLDNCVRDTDTVARLGGDEFTIVMTNLRYPYTPDVLAQRILDSLAQPFLLEGKEVSVSGSIGITVSPADGTDAGELLKNADTAMYRAKELGKANYQFFTAAINQQVQERNKIKTGLRKALAEDQFQLHYQPKLDLASGRLAGFEALMRWHSDELGNVPPDKFIPILEEMDFVIDVGEWLVRTACRQYKSWLDAGLPPMPIAVNMSGNQLRNPAMRIMVEGILNETGVDASCLEVEVTERVIMSDSELCIKTLMKLNDMGVRASMDDFGTGTSSLSYLKRLPISTIKIDKSFINDIVDSPDDLAIVKTILALGRTLGHKVVAEGVETKEQLEILRALHCDQIQGYYFGRPLPADEATKFIRAHEGMPELPAGIGSGAGLAVPSPSAPPAPL